MCVGVGGGGGTGEGGTIHGQKENKNTVVHLKLVSLDGGRDVCVCVCVCWGGGEGVKRNYSCIKGGYEHSSAFQIVFLEGGRIGVLGEGEGG